MRKYEKLQVIINEIDELIQKNVTPSSPEFRSWKVKAERFLIGEYGLDSYEMNEFKKNKYSLLFFTSETSKEDIVEACKKGLEHAKAFLSLFVDDLEGDVDFKRKVSAFNKLKYEFSGIKKVIESYTSGGFISNFLNGLEQGIKECNRAQIEYFLSEIYKWYEDKWGEIRNNDYVYNLDEHIRNKNLLQEIIDGIAVDDSIEINNNIKSNYLFEPVILLSHSSADKKYGDALEKLFMNIGVKTNQLIYTSHPLHKIPLDNNIYDYLRETFGKNIFVIILWSKNYLNSAACLNELGAMWVTKSDYTNLYVPVFDFNDGKYNQCPIDKNKMGAILDGGEQCKAAIVELKNKITSLFDLRIEEQRWIYVLDQFIKEVSC